MHLFMSRPRTEASTCSRGVAVSKVNSVMPYSSAKAWDSQLPHWHE